MGNRGIGESGNRGIGESGSPGIGESGNRGIRESGNPGIGESGNPGIGESGNRGIRESGNQGIINFWTFCGIKQAIKTFFGKACNVTSRASTTHNVSRSNLTLIYFL